MLNPPAGIERKKEMKKKENYVELHSGAHKIFGFIKSEDLEKLALVKPFRIYREYMYSPRAFEAQGKRQDNNAAMKLIREERPKGESLAVLYTLTDIAHQRDIPSALESERLLELYRMS